MKNSVIKPNKLKFHVFQDERFIDLNLYQFGWERTDPAHSYGPHARNHYLFHYVISGKGTLFANEKTYSISAGQGFLVVPDQITTYRADDDDPWEYTWIEFDGLRAHENLRLAGISGSEPVYTAANKAAGKKLEQQMLYIVENGESDPVYLIGQGFLFLYQLAASSGHRQDRNDRKLRDFYMKEALAFIEHNYQDEISVEDIADCIGLNRAYFGKIFRETMGETPQAFLMHYRMSKAEHLLKSTRLEIKDICIQVGYPNPLHFSRAFKGVYGESPRQWRESHWLL